MEASEYQCAMCQGVFTKAYSDEEAMAETQSYWPGVAQQDCAVVCDDCYQKIHPETHPQEYEDSLFQLEIAGASVVDWKLHWDETLSESSTITFSERIVTAFAIPPAMLGELSNTNYDAGWQRREDAYKQRFFKRKKR